MFAPRPRKTTEPNNVTPKGQDSFSVVRCETIGTEDREFLVYQILGPPELFNDFPGDDLTSAVKSTDYLETVDEFNIRKRKPRLKNNEAACTSDVGQTPVRLDNAPGIVVTYGSSTVNNDDDAICESSSQMDTEEALSSSIDQAEDTNELLGEQAGVSGTETPVRKSRVRDMSGRSRTPGWHICTQCSYTTNKRSKLEKHLEVHWDKPRIKCNKCELNFPNESALKKHQLSHNSPYRCSQCGSGFSNYLKLESHFMKEHAYAALYNCKECSYSCSRIENMRRHVRCHTGERPYQCPHCTYAGADAFKLKRHILTHLGEKPYKCDTCDASFTQINDLKAHKYRHSSGKLPHACDKCELSFVTASRLRTHIRLMHTAREPILCRVCKLALPDKHNYKLHMQSHKANVQNSLNCDECSMPFTRPSDLRRHKLTDHRESQPIPQQINSKNLDPWICSQCNITLISEHKYRLHMEYHREVIRRPHKCNECASSFTSLSSLKKHQLSAHRPLESYPSDQQINSTDLEISISGTSHTAEPIEYNYRSHSEHREEDDCRPHKCNKCTSSFARPADLRRHEFLLHRPQDIHCRKCELILPDKHNYKLHIQVHKNRQAINANRDTDSLSEK